MVVQVNFPFFFSKDLPIFKKEKLKESQSDSNKEKLPYSKQNEDKEKKVLIPVLPKIIESSGKQKVLVGSDPYIPILQSKQFFLIIIFLNILKIKKR